jgi:hypothetical protein
MWGRGPAQHKKKKKKKNSALIYEPKCGGGAGGCGVSANECNCEHGAQINFGDLTFALSN